VLKGDLHDLVRFIRKEVPIVKLKINFNCNFLLCIENNLNQTRIEWVNDI